MHRPAGARADFIGRAPQHVLGAGDDRHVAAGIGERLRATAAEPATRRADQRPFPGYPEVHGVQGTWRASAARPEDARRTRNTVPIPTT